MSKVASNPLRRGIIVAVGGVNELGHVAGRVDGPKSKLGKLYFERQKGSSFFFSGRSILSGALFSPLDQIMVVASGARHGRFGQLGIDSLVSMGASDRNRFG